VVAPPPPVFTFNIVHRTDGAPAKRGSWISGPPDHSFMLGFADLDESPPDVEESHVPYYIAEAFLLTFTCVAAIPARMVVGGYQLTIEKAREIIEHLITDMEFDFGAGSVETLALAIKSAYVTHGDEALRLAADDFEDVPEPVADSAAGLTNSLCRGLSFYSLLSHDLPGRGDMQMLFIMLGQRGFHPRRMARLQEAHDLLDGALRRNRRRPPPRRSEREILSPHRPVDGVRLRPRGHPLQACHYPRDQLAGAEHSSQRWDHAERRPHQRVASQRFSFFAIGPTMGGRAPSGRSWDPAEIE
jgi:hypothetical protein